MDTGVFTWIKSTGTARVGSVAGWLRQDGYMSVRLMRRNYFAHRLAWLCVNRMWPNDQVDHINGNRADNRWKNLRDVTHAVNTQNQRAASKNSKSGFLGVVLKGGRWAARIRPPGGTSMDLGVFGTKEEAYAAYVLAKRRLHEGCTL